MAHVSRPRSVIQLDDAPNVHALESEIVSLLVLGSLIYRIYVAMTVPTNVHMTPKVVRAELGGRREILSKGGRKEGASTAMVHRLESFLATSVDTPFLEQTKICLLYTSPSPRD